ncbi:uncharacterized protein LOC117341458 [Pecten maximus]|uniref:uncharacterized protein LOC117341458 n=1 Tax=Pecten maximus TaxID=6579 RepID=UPI0014585DB9|nr:uncharacterized protein LOC117341458 [Pecten maximus]
MKFSIFSYATAITITFLIRIHASCFIGLEQTLFKDRINNNHMIRQSSVISVLSCLRQCFKLATCMSFFYNEMTNVCNLQGIVYLYEEQGSADLGSRYFVPMGKGKCPDFGGFMYNRALEICYNFKCCELYNANELKAKCNATGTSLIKIDSSEKQAHMAAFLEQGNTSYTLIQGILGNNGIYTYEDGTNMTYFNWNSADNEPEQRNNEVFILLKKNDQFLWHDARNTATYASSNLVCETPVL